MEEVLKWDHELRRTKTFSTGFLILSSRRFESPNLEELQNILLKFIDRPAQEYFLCRSPQSNAFEELVAASKLGWKSETSRKKKWSVRFVADHLALLLVLQRQVEKEKETPLNVDQSTRSASGGCPRPLLSSVPSESSGLFMRSPSSSTFRRRGMRRTWYIVLPHSLRS